jgi:tRNA threonylcarbamoyl adenosine modification protein YeaZ
VLLLALDTATASVTAALHDGSAVVAESTVVDGRRHGEQLAPRIDAVLAAAGASPRDLTDVVVGVGPGPFTGLRVGVVTALTLGAALGIRVAGVCSLDALAYASGVDGPLTVVTDARRREVYWASYADGLTRTAGPEVAEPSVVVEVAAGQPFVGPATGLYPFPDAVADATGRPHQLSAGALALLAALRLAAGDPLLPPRPLYLRRPDAQPPGARKRVLA